MKEENLSQDGIINRILNYYPKHPMNMAINVTKAFIRRVLTVSHKKFHKEVKTKIGQILAKNNFHDKVIQRLLNQVWHSPNRNNVGPNNTIIEPSYPLIDVTNDLDSTQMSNKNVQTTSTLASNQTTELRRFAGMTYIPGLT